MSRRGAVNSEGYVNNFYLSSSNHILGEENGVYSVNEMDHVRKNER